MRIGILGGTFDPPHGGHIALAQAARSELKLDEVIFIPAARNPLKTTRQYAIASQRFDMVKLATEDYSYFAVSDIEIRRIVYGLEQAGLVEIVKPPGMEQQASSANRRRPQARTPQVQKTVVNKLIDKIRSI